MKFCIIWRGSCYKSDSESLYLLLVEHVGTTDCRSNLEIKHKYFKDGRQYSQGLKSQFHNAAYKQNITISAKK